VVILPSGQVATYSYDPFGRRIKKQLGNDATWYVYADEGLVGEYDATGAMQKIYGWKPDGLWGTDPLYMLDGSGTYFYHNDHLGTPQRLTDATTGAVVWSAGYAAFGKATIDPLSTVENNLRFPGQYFDAETGLHYNWNRTYDPGTGRYTQVDPIGFAGGDLNVYRYVGNGVVLLFDVSGLLVNPVHWWLDKHYKRNKNNRSGNFEDVRDPTSGWELQSPEKSRYHRMGKGNEKNLKYVHFDGSELVFTPDGTSGALVISPVNMGTYNYINPDGFWGMVGHGIFDVVPYYFLGNSLDDPTTMYERIAGTYGDLDSISPCQ
jgi:RHS repeat-associated protein